MTNPKQNERRHFPRREVSVTATLSVDGHQATLETRDLSKGGAFLKRGDSPLPAEGTELFVDISSSVPGEEPMVVRAQVVYVSADGIGILFLD